MSRNTQPAGASPEFTRVDNNCTHVIALPPTDTYPRGHALIPGVNKVPTDYLKSIAEFKVPHITHEGRNTKRKLFEDLAEPSKTSSGRPRVVVLGNIDADAEEGPPPPFSLDEYGEPLALKIIEVTKDLAALERWSRDKRGDVATAAAKKLAR